MRPGSDGETAAALAERAGHDEVVEILEAGDNGLLGRF